MEVALNPLPEDRHHGTSSFLSWDSFELRAALMIAFHVSRNEEIARIEIRKDGIRAIIEQRESQ